MKCNEVGVGGVANEMMFDVDMLHAVTRGGVAGCFESSLIVTVQSGRRVLRMPEVAEKLTQPEDFLAKASEAHILSFS